MTRAIVSRNWRTYQTSYLILFQCVTYILMHAFTLCRRKVYSFRSRGIYLSIDRYIRFIRKVYTFFYVMYTACDEENMTLRKFRKQERYRECLFLAAQTDNHFAQREVCETSNMFGITQLPLICLSKFPTAPQDLVKLAVEDWEQLPDERKPTNKRNTWRIEDICLLLPCNKVKTQWGKRNF